jgi:hypothetical protein
MEPHKRKRSSEDILVIDPVMCKNEIDYYTTDDWQTSPPSIYINFIYPDGSQSLQCFDDRGFRKALKTKKQWMYLWIQDPDVSEPFDKDTGMGGMPDIRGPPYVKLPSGEFLKTNKYTDDIAKGQEDYKYDAVFIGNQRLGNVEGSFYASELHGQIEIPIYELANPTPVAQSKDKEKRYMLQADDLVGLIGDVKLDTDKVLSEVELLESRNPSNQVIQKFFSDLMTEPYKFETIRSMMLLLVVQFIETDVRKYVTRNKFPVNTQIHITPKFYPAMVEHIKKTPQLHPIFVTLPSESAHVWFNFLFDFSFDGEWIENLGTVPIRMSVSYFIQYGKYSTSYSGSNGQEALLLFATIASVLLIDEWMVSEYFFSSSGVSFLRQSGTNLGVLVMKLIRGPSSFTAQDLRDFVDALDKAGYMAESVWD